ncbi:hypothetical protein GCM10010275_39890 [Streptomyces litmocidini]|uniref:hypothetical protein n=1 Tax=Streptomyces litmocidini TaxID=67318 RepID=UPI00167E5139|nr:hypothetical protein [Streptomyces litmocidini]GGU97502.1 hypothetical protein GCM10010275_39890 [Streptomyces litmocidini]
MSGVALTLRALHHGERHLEQELVAVADRHRTDHEVHHVATDLARWSDEHADRIADAARAHGLDLKGGTEEEPGEGLLSAVREKTAEPPGHPPEPGLLLLRDLRSLHLAAAENSLYWEMLAQYAQAAKDDRLLALSSACHPRTLRQMRWTNAMIKALSPQILTALRTHGDRGASGRALVD